MTSFPGSPKTLRGALVSLDVLSLKPLVIPFQYNPHTLTRSFEVGGAAGGPEAGQVSGPPAETIKVEVELDATDDLEQGRGATGVAAKLAALEMLVTPGSVSVIANAVLAALGTIEILPPAGPLTLFIWGARRVLPVAIKELSVSEEAHDENLDPLRAKVSLGMRVLTYADLSVTHPGYALSLAHQVAKEVMAVSSTVGALDGVLGGDVRLV